MSEITSPPPSTPTTRPSRPASYQMYDATPEQLQDVREYAKMREQLKKEFQMKVTDPYSRMRGGHIFDPAMQRFLSMKSNAMDYYRITPKTLVLGFLAVVPLTWFSIHRYIKNKKKKENLLRTGQVSYYNRRHQFMT